MVKNTVYKNGSVIAVWINSDNNDELKQNYWSFYNHGATSAEDLNWTNKGEGYFWSNERKLKRYFKNSSRAIVLNELGEDWEGDATTGPEGGERIAEVAQDRFDELMSNSGPNPLAKTLVEPYLMGSVSAERDSGNFDDYLTKVIQGA